MVAPIILFVYARPEHTRKTIYSLRDNINAKESELFIFSDAPRNNSQRSQVVEVREFVSYVAIQNWFKSVHVFCSIENKGLAKSIILGVSQIIAEYGKVIVVEDDLVTTINFIDYMNEALEYYQDEKSIWSISGYTDAIKLPEDYKNDIFFSLRGCSWGWATWLDRWSLVDWEVKEYDKFEFNYFERKRFNFGGKDMSAMLDAQMDGRIDSWAIRWCYSQYKNKMLTVYPVKTKVLNIGLDGTGTHRIVRVSNELSTELSKTVFEDIVIDQRIIKSFKNELDKNIRSELLSFTKHLFYKFLKKLTHLKNC